MRQWEETSEDEEEITVKRSEGGKLQVEKVQRAPELVDAQAQMRKKQTGEGKTNKIASWSTVMLEKVASRQEHEDTKKWCGGGKSARRV